MKVNSPEGAKEFLGLLPGNPNQYSTGKKNCLTIIGKKLFAPPGPLAFFF